MIRIGPCSLARRVPVSGLCSPSVYSRLRLVPTVHHVYYSGRNGPGEPVDPAGSGPRPSLNEQNKPTAGVNGQPVNGKLNSSAAYSPKGPESVNEFGIPASPNVQASPKVAPGVDEMGPSAKPGFVRRYLNAVASAPVSHLISFVSMYTTVYGFTMVSVWAVVHHFGYAPLGGIPNWILVQGLDFVSGLSEWFNWLNIASQSARWVSQGAAAYSIAKVLLPVRLFFTLLLTRWFARVVVIPINSRIARIFKWFIPKRFRSQK
uniref:ARAD1D49082p n=1 Tax=Blastobotrys adeninivorans TaxID=409370 RepID=A0A060TD97_BLAAD